jgi:hypothetical protein
MEITLQDLEEWQTALRERAKKQHAKRLRTISSDKWCCLGVFCDLQKDKIGLKVTIDNVIEPMAQYDEESHGLPMAVQERFKTLGSGPRIPVSFLTEKEREIIPREAELYRGKYAVSAMSLNDLGFTFERIAELLPYGCTIIDNYTDRNILKPLGV